MRFYPAIPKWDFTDSFWIPCNISLEYHPKRQYVIWEISFLSKNFLKARRKVFIWTFMNIPTSSISRLTLYPTILALNFHVNRLLGFCIVYCIVRNDPMWPCFIWVVDLGKSFLSQWDVGVDIFELSWFLSYLILSALEMFGQDLKEDILSWFTFGSALNLPVFSSSECFAAQDFPQTLRWGETILSLNHRS